MKIREAFQAVFCSLWMLIEVIKKHVKMNAHLIKKYSTESKLEKHKKSLFFCFATTNNRIIECEKSKKCS